jgi:apolipoprotein D and lipocalin family protein
MASFRVSIRLGVLSLLLAAAAGSASAADEIKAGNKPIDPQRYLGRWYEVARLPNGFQKNCEAATSDWSKKGNGQYDVVQTCHTGSPSGPPQNWRGVGRVLDQTTARIRIAFFAGFIKQDYVVVDRSDDYSWCILATTTPKFVWIMSRRAVLNSAQKSVLVARAKQLGLNLTGLVFDQQPPG